MRRDPPLDQASGELPAARGAITACETLDVLVAAQALQDASRGSLVDAERGRDRRRGPRAQRDDLQRSERPLGGGVDLHHGV
jgi:hypothetical protein